MKTKASRGLSCLQVSHDSPTPLTAPTPVPHWAGRAFTHRRGALEFGPAVGEVVGGCFTAHWFQLEREKGNVTPSEVGETALLRGESLTRFPPSARLKPDRREQDP